GSHVPDVDRRSGRVVGRGAQRAIGERAVVEAEYLVAAVAENRHQDGTEITLMSCDEYAHVDFSRIRSVPVLADRLDVLNKAYSKNENKAETYLNLVLICV